MHTHPVEMQKARWYAPFQTPLHVVTLRGSDSLRILNKSSEAWADLFSITPIITQTQGIRAYAQMSQAIKHLFHAWGSLGLV